MLVGLGGGAERKVGKLDGSQAELIIRLRSYLAS